MTVMEHNKEFLDLLLDRRSCRAFRPDALDRPTLAAIVETGRYAPSAMDTQQNHFYIITDQKLLKQLSELVSRMLAAYSMGVGSCWLNQPFHLQDDPDLRALLAPLGVTEKDLLCCALALGLPQGELPRSRPERTGNLITWVDGV